MNKTLKVAIRQSDYRRFKRYQCSIKMLNIGSNLAILILFYYLCTYQSEKT